MPATLYEATVQRFEQTLTATAAFLQKGHDHCQENSIDLGELVETRLYPDMLPLRFQVVSTAHHAAGAIAAARSGEFRPPPASDGMSFSALQQRIAEAIELVSATSADEIKSLENNDLVFRLGERELPFVVGDFLLSFSIPNFYFHATTTYDILRMQGVPLGKRDFIGYMQMKR